MKTIASSYKKNIFTNDSSLKTNKLTKFLLILFLTLIPLIIIWVIFCQFNLLGLNWVVAQNGKYFISNSEIEKINANIIDQAKYLSTNVNFYVWKITNQNDENYMSYLATTKVISNYGVGYIFSNWMFLLIFGILAVNLAIYIPLSLFSKKIYLDIFPMFLSSWFGMTTLILTGLIPQNHAYTIPVQILTIVIIFITALLLFNFIFNKIIANSKWAESYYKKLIFEDKESEQYYKDYLKNKKKVISNDKKVIDIPNNQNPDFKKNGENKNV